MIQKIIGIEKKSGKKASFVADNKPAYPSESSDVDAMSSFTEEEDLEGMDTSEVFSSSQDSDSQASKKRALRSRNNLLSDTEPQESEMSQPMTEVRRRVMGRIEADQAKFDAEHPEHYAPLDGDESSSLSDGKNNVTFDIKEGSEAYSDAFSIEMQQV